MRIQANLWLKFRMRAASFKYRSQHMSNYTQMTFPNFQEYLKFSVVTQMSGMSLLG